MNAGELSPRTRRNLRAFILFRIFFNCRFYYPVFMILFLDFGLSVEQFALLNAAWAVAITLLEVPSGALADQLGRRTLVLAAAVLMVVEMLVLYFTPIGAGAVVFWMFLINRVISGAAEAAASGADEALAYDSIPAERQKEVWAKVTSRLMFWQSLTFFIVTIVGALVYDPTSLNRAASWLGMETAFTKADTIKLPILLNVGTAVVTLAVASGLRELPGDSEPRASRETVGASFRKMIGAGKWIWRTPAPLILIVVGVMYDGFIRLFYSVASNYYRLIEIPDRYFGFLSALASLLGLGAAWAVLAIKARTRPATQFNLVALLIALGLLGLAFPAPIYGALVIIPLGIGMRFLHYFLSNHLNSVTDSSHRATVLSFKGLALNLNYGLMILFFGWQTALIRGRLPQGEEAAAQWQNATFAQALSWWLPAFLLAFILTRLWTRARSGGSFNRLFGP